MNRRGWLSLAGLLTAATVVVALVVVARAAESVVVPSSSPEVDGGRDLACCGDAGEAGPPAVALRHRADFVRVRGAKLVVGGAPFRFVGANLAVMHGPDSRAGAASLIGAAAADGIRVGRVWALGEGAADAAPWQRENFYFRAGPDGWIAAASEQLDRVLAAAAANEMRLIVTLSNSWSDYGGVPQYLRWSGHGRDGARDDVYGAADRFYGDPRARAAFRAHVERLLGRTNTVTGVRYRDDPTILAWELMNESHVDTAAGARARRAWIVEMARLVHRLAPNHLVASGVTGYRLERERREWLALCALPEIDYCDGHFYPEEMLGARDTAMLDALIDAFLDDFAQLALHVARKPFVLGEFGVHGDAEGRWRGEPRARWTARIFERLRFDGASGGLVWIYQSTPGTPEGHGISVGEPGASALRGVVRAAADALAMPPPAGDAPNAEGNPLLGPERGAIPLYPLRAEIDGPAVVVPKTSDGVGDDAAETNAVRIAWAPTAFARASWEATGAYAGGALVHVWGAETGYFEYDYDVPATADRAARWTANADRAAPRRLTVRARVSSEFPGTLSPPDGASAFEVSIDGVPFGKASAVRDDGLGRSVTLASTRAEVIAAATRPGRHRLRFAVPDGARAHGLCIYGELGQKPKLKIAPARIELGWARAR